jgi:uncharacterized membrane protein
MNLALWIAAGLLAVLFAVAGLVKLTQPKEKLAGSQPWVEDFQPSVIKAIGAAEVLGALGLILPAVTGIAPALVPLAAVGLALTQAGAIAVHARRGERQNVVVNVVLLALALFVAWGRFGDYAF